MAPLYIQSCVRLCNSNSPKYVTEPVVNLRSVLRMDLGLLRYSSHSKLPSADQIPSRLTFVMFSRVVNPTRDLTRSSISR
jgi:hypothetical protein